MTSMLNTYPATLTELNFQIYKSSHITRGKYVEKDLYAKPLNQDEVTRVVKG